MTIRDDPERVEVKTLLRNIALKEKEVLEIGCGDGRLTLKYFRRAGKVTAIDPMGASIRKAKKAARGVPNAPTFRVARAEKLPFHNASFDTVLFTWSLCCIDIPAMGRAIEEAGRVLRPGGSLVNIQPSLYQPFPKGAISFLLTGRFGTSADDESYRQARLALKYSALIEEKFKLISEEQFTINTYYDTKAELLKDLTLDFKDEYRALGPKERRKMSKLIDALGTKKGMMARDNVVLTVLAKTPWNGG